MSALSQLTPRLPFAGVRRDRIKALVGAVLFGAAATAAAGPITFNTALPIAKGEILFRGQYIGRHLDDHTRRPDRNVTVNGGLAVLAYGVTGRLAVFGAAPYLAKTLDLATPMGRIHRLTQGFGDTTLFARYTLYENDFPGGSLRIAPILGAVAPTGDANDRDRFGLLPRPFQLGTGAWGGLGGAILTYQTLRYEFDADATYRAFGRHRGFSAGNVASLDASFQYRIATPPGFGTDAPAFLYTVLESNLIHTERDQLNGSNLSTTGGTEWLIDPGIQYVTRRYVIEAAVQLPIEHNVPNGALRDDYIVHVGFRVNF